MVHAHTARVLDEWRRHRAGRRLPARTELAPALFGALLPQMFVLAEDGGAWRVRLGGGFVTDLLGRELKDEPFPALWSRPDRPRATEALEAAHDLAEPRVLACRAKDPQGGAVALEMVLAPVTGPMLRPDRVLGLLQPVGRAPPPPAGRPGELHLPPQALCDPADARPRLVVDNTRASPLR